MEVRLNNINLKACGFAAIGLFIHTSFALAEIWSLK